MTSDRGLDHDVEMVSSFDGTKIAARAMGTGDSTPLLVCNAVGVNLAPWRRTLFEVVDERRIIAWDHRGLHSSGPPASDRIDPGAHAEDAIAVVDHFDVERFAIASWSTGSRIALELAQRYPERIPALAIVNGGYGHTLKRALFKAEPISMLPVAVGVAKHFAVFFEQPFRTLISRPELAGLVRQSGFVGPTADTYALVEVLRSMAECDLKRLLATYEAVAGSAAPELLQGIEAPTLLIAGGRDAIAPLGMIREMAREIPRSTIEIYERATHYLPLEFPGRLATDLRRFWTDIAHI